MSQYEIPTFGTTSDRLLPWLLEAVQEGEAWRAAQNPTVEWDKIREMLGVTNPNLDLTNGMSNVGYNKGKRIFRELVASLSNFRHEGEFKPRFDKQLYSQAHVLTKLDASWHTETNSYEQFRAGMQYAVGFGTGYWLEEWDRTYWGTHGDVLLEAISPDDVTFLQLPSNYDVQKAYAVIIRREMPINLARFVFDRGDLMPDRDAPKHSLLQKGLKKVQQFIGGSPFLRAAGNRKDKDAVSFPTVDVFHMYVMDRSVNQSPTERTMGAYGTNWSYKVPALGSEMETGLVNPATGSLWTRPATPQDCRLFPLRRMCVFSRTTTLYDGSSPWWHGQVPLAKLRFGDVAWEALGQSLLGDIRTMQDGIVAIMRAVEDSIAARLDPPALFDDQLVSEGFAKKFNPRMAGVRAAAAINAGEVIKFPIPKEQYDVPSYIPEWVKSQEARMDYMAATPDLVAVAKAKQVPGEGTLEKLLEMAGPLVQDLVRANEQPLRQLGEWRKAYYFQFYTHGRILQIAGPDETTEDFNYQPDLLVPHIEGEPLQAKQQRTRRYLSEHKYRLTESGWNEMHRMINRLALLQLQKAGVPIDWWTIAKAWKLSNFGPEPEGTNNVMERFKAQETIKYEMAAEAQQHAQELGIGPQGGGGHVGRPATNQKPPHLVQKDGGTRSTVKTS